MNVWAVYADLERRGFTFRVRGNELSIAPAMELTDDDDARINRYLGELIDLVARYQRGDQGTAFMLAAARAHLGAFTVDGVPLCACGAMAPADGCHQCEACSKRMRMGRTQRETVSRPEARPAA